ncbi:MarR family winged helix-turn-helix transcriptional regulator [Taylorella equigenitalis]|nr:MarR family transcriptional regulator [Taylorella equigenitalis]AFN36028.1 putative transcriptional regulator [Taylorella equigenitalis ATCC 35865]ASY30660.1 transcriptional regulator [Taylorella equigenitalis]ASY37967.1 transcriptional regulator [Taylorella equigenitalis]ASY39441.1 transcriptional regulator [Taylorella equigenitalis]ASY40954.1 transcriptional regulator [Taylorella equigenitalis]
MEELDNYLLLCLRFNAYFINQKIAKVAEKAKLGISQFNLLHLLYCNGTIKATELRYWLPNGPGYIDSLILQMVERGYIQRLRSPKDKRVIQVRLTHEGMHIVDSLIDEYEKGILDSFAILDEDDKYNLIHLLKKLGRGL